MQSDQLLKKFLKESNPGKKLINVSLDISGESTSIQGLLSLLEAIQYCTKTGRSRTFKVDVDGDGAAFLKFKITSGKEEIKDLQYKLEKEDYEEIDKDKFSVGMGN